MIPTPDDHGVLAPYAVHDERTLGRRHAEPLPDDPAFELDRRRILHCTSFRRLVNKTQVFVTHEGDHFRTRLTHTLEVASHARRLAAALQLNQTLAEAVALAHDLGHPPFGHAGEQALAELMAEAGGFEHNIQSLRVVDYLEHPYPPFRGLNLGFELRESLLKHCTPYDRPDAGGTLDPAALELLASGPLPPLEGQVANVADIMAYTLHDIEDGLMQSMIDEAALMGSPLWRQAAEPVRREWPNLPVAAVRRPILDRLADRLTQDAAEAGRRRIAAADIRDAGEVRHSSSALVGFSSELEPQLANLHDLLRRSVYGHHRVVRMDSKARRLIRDLFAAYAAEPQLMPPRYVERLPEQGAARVVCDYIAGMTDRFCRLECARLFNPDHFDS